MKDLALEPVNRDLANGILTMDNSLLNNVYLSLMTPLGGWWPAPEFGSKLHLLAKEKFLPRVAKTAVDYCRESVKWIVDGGRARAIDITAELDEKNRRAVCRISVTKNDGTALDYTHFVRVG
jgi:phage gp46-like protein